MATKDPQLNAWELITLIGSKAQMIHGHMTGVMNGMLSPRDIALADMGNEIKRMAELHLALKEAVAAMPKPIQVSPQPEASRRN